MRIAIGSIIHESNTFSTLFTDIDAFKRKQYLKGSDVISAHRGTRSELGGFLSAIPGAIEIVPTISAVAMPSGIVTRAAYDELRDELLSRLPGDGCDGIFLALHGSMCVEDLEDPEGDLLSILRKKYPGTVIGCTLDHHANVSKAMVANSDFLVGFRTHPHVDQYEVGVHAAGLIMDPRLRKAEKAFIQIPMVTPAENRTEPISLLKQRTEELCARPGILSASYFVGYPWADVSIMGSSVYVLQQPGVSQPYAEEFASLLWSLRDAFHYEIRDLSSLGFLMSPHPQKPVILNELSDCTFGGSSGDVVSTATYLVKHRAPSAAVVGIVDPTTVEEAFSLGEGTWGDFSIGGKICLRDNPPLHVRARVESLHRNVRPKSPMLMESGMLFTRVAVLRVDDVRLMMIEYPGQIGGPAFFDAIGLSAENFQTIVVKEGLNPFVTYRETAREIIMVESPGFDPQKLSPDLYRHLNRSIYPIQYIDLDAFMPRRSL